MLDSTTYSHVLPASIMSLADIYEAPHRPAKTIKMTGKKALFWVIVLNIIFIFVY